jgi:hypothetical protein
LDDVAYSYITIVNTPTPETTTSSVDIDQPSTSAGDPTSTINTSSPCLENLDANVGEVKGSSTASDTDTQSAPKIDQQPSPVDISASATHLADKAETQPEHTQDECATSEGNKTDAGITQSPENLTPPVPESEKGQEVTDNTGEPLTGTSRFIVLEREPNLLISEIKHSPADVPEAPEPSNTTEHHVDDPVSQTQEQSHIISSTAAPDTPEELSGITTSSSPADAGKLHPEAPILTITPPVSSAPVTMSDLASVNTVLLPDRGPDASSTSPPADTTVTKETLLVSDQPQSTSPDGSSALGKSEVDIAKETRGMDETAPPALPTNLQTDGPGEPRLSGEKSSSQDGVDGKELPLTIPLPIPFPFDVDLLLTLYGPWTPASKCSTSAVEDETKACNNDNMKTVNEGECV